MQHEIIYSTLAVVILILLWRLDHVAFLSRTYQAEINEMIGRGWLDVTELGEEYRKFMSPHGGRVIVTQTIWRDPQITRRERQG